MKKLSIIIIALHSLSCQKGGTGVSGRGTVDDLIAVASLFGTQLDNGHIDGDVTDGDVTDIISGAADFDILDPFNNAYEVFYIADRRMLFLVSGGKDGSIGTSDDIVRIALIPPSEKRAGQSAE